MSEEPDPDLYSLELQIPLAEQLLDGAVAMLEKEAGSARDSTVTGQRRTDAGGLFKKCIYHAGSITHLLKGTPLNPVTVHDYHSIGALTRDLFENVLLLAFVVCGRTIPDDERQYRHDAWRLSGFRQRWEMVDPTKYPIEHARDQSELVGLKQRLTSNPYVQSLTPKQKDAVIDRGQWQFVTGNGARLEWGDMVQTLGYSRTYFDRAYADLSQYLHTTSTTVFKAAQALPATEKELAGVLSPRMMMALSLAMAEFGTLFPNAESEFAKDTDKLSIRQCYLSVLKNVQT